MTISVSKRAEITAWATQKAMDDAKEAGKVRPQEHGSAAIAHDCWIQEKIWHYEKMAYLKIDRRESGMKK